MGISADSHWSHKAFADQNNFDFPLLSDWFGNVGRLYGIWSEEKQRERRVIFIIDPAGVVSYEASYGDEQMPDIQAAIDALRDLYYQEEQMAG